MQYAGGILQPPADKTGGIYTICPQRGNSAIESCCPPSNPAPPPMKANGFHGFSYFQPFQTIFLNFHVRAASKRRGHRSRSPFPMKPFAERASHEAAASLPLAGRYHKKPLGEISGLRKEPWIRDGSQKTPVFLFPMFLHRHLRVDHPEIWDAVLLARFECSCYCDLTVQFRIILRKVVCPGQDKLDTL